MAPERETQAQWNARRRRQLRRARRNKYIEHAMLAAGLLLIGFTLYLMLGNETKDVGFPGW